MQSVSEIWPLQCKYCLKFGHYYVNIEIWLLWCKHCLRFGHYYVNIVWDLATAMQTLPEIWSLHCWLNWLLKILSEIWSLQSSLDKCGHHLIIDYYCTVWDWYENFIPLILTAAYKSGHKSRILPLDFLPWVETVISESQSFGW